MFSTFMAENIAKRSSDASSETQEASSPVKRARIEVKDDPSISFKYTREVIPILVGSRVFKIHEDLLTSTSAFFRNAMKPEWRVDSTKPIDLSGKDPVHFEKYFEWLYAKVLSLHSNGEPKWKYMASMYVLGEEIMDATFQNVMINAMISCSNWSSLPHLGNIKIIYDGTPSMSPARRLLVDIYAYNMKHGGTGMSEIAYGDEYRLFLGDLYVAMLKHRPSPLSTGIKPWVADRESYRVTSGEVGNGVNGGEADKLTNGTVNAIPSPQHTPASSFPPLDAGAFDATARGGYGRGRFATRGGRGR